MRDMRYTHFVKTLIKPAEIIYLELTREKTNLLHMAVGLAGESGEVLEAVLHTRMHNRETLIKELGDYEFYLEGLRQCIDYQKISVPDRSRSSPATDLTLHTLSILEHVKKVVINGHLINDQLINEQLVYIESCLSDIRAYNIYGLITHTEVINANINKLKTRYDGLYSDINSIQRRDEA